ncbi:MAG: helix-turn-helix domain-containing protein [Halobacteriales archaeon]|nr:helix-turn-helix domain-containing protein [Halobacteriales archaeon]
MEQVTAPTTEEVFEALADPDCREIVETLDSPMTTGEISDACDLPLSTTYRKVNMLEEATLLNEQVEVRTDGKHTNTYTVDFERVCAFLDESHSLKVDVSRPETRDERLENLWREVRRET